MHLFIVLILIAITTFFCFFEGRMGKKQKMCAYIALGVALIALAGFRKIDLDPDSHFYEHLFLNPYEVANLLYVDYSYILLSQWFSSFTDDVHFLFLFYAAIGVTLKFVAFRLFSKEAFFLVLVYLCYYFELHEMTQIRAGIVSGCFLVSLYLIQQNRRVMAFLLILLSCFFHASGFALLLVFFISRSPLTPSSIRFWIAVIPLSVASTYVLSSFSLESHLPYIGEKLAYYTVSGDLAFGFRGYFYYFNICIFLYASYFYETIQSQDRYFPYIYRLMSLALVMYAALSFSHVISTRIAELYRIVSIIFIADLRYTIKQKWAGILLILLIGAVCLYCSHQWLDGTYPAN